MKLALAATALLAVGASSLEASARDFTSFERADLNRDGFVSQAEYHRTQLRETHMLFQRADQENDRRLDREEYARLDFLFERRKRFANR